MKYCTKCGKEILDDAVICMNCGCMVEQNNTGNFVTSLTEQEKKTQTSLILGIIGIVFAWIFALIGHITSIIGIVIGTKEYKKTGKTPGLVLSIIGEICSVISSIIGVLAMTNTYSYL